MTRSIISSALLAGIIAGSAGLCLVAVHPTQPAVLVAAPSSAGPSSAGPAVPANTAPTTSAPPSTSPSTIPTASLVVQCGEDPLSGLVPLPACAALASVPSIATCAAGPGQTLYSCIQAQYPADIEPKLAQVIDGCNPLVANGWTWQQCQAYIESPGGYQCVTEQGPDGQLAHTVPWCVANVKP
jgi:hypothetical protein